MHSIPPPSTSVKPRSSGRTKHRAVKSVPTKVVSSPRTKKRANRPTNDAETLSADHVEPVRSKRRKFVANYFYEELSTSDKKIIQLIVFTDW